MNNPLDVHLTVRVTQTQLAGEETIQVSLPGEEKTIAVKLNHSFGGKVVRLRNAASNKAGDVFLHLQVVDTPSHLTPESSHGTTEKISLYGYEISRKDWALWVHMCGGDGDRARRLYKYEHEQFLSRGFFYNSEQDPVNAAMQRYRDDQK